jgi:hypothetical protein
MRKGDDKSNSKGKRERKEKKESPSFYKKKAIHVFQSPPIGNWVHVILCSVFVTVYFKKRVV